jgi:hypothetical protein
MEDQGVWEVVEPSGVGETVLEGQAAAAARTAKDKKARAHLLRCLSDDLLMQVANKKTGKVWECLKERFVGADQVKEERSQTLKSEFDALHMKDDEGVD